MKRNGLVQLKRGAALWFEEAPTRWVKVYVMKVEPKRLVVHEAHDDSTLNIEYRWVRSSQIQLRPPKGAEVFGNIAAVLA